MRAKRSRYNRGEINTRQASDPRKHGFGLVEKKKKNDELADYYHNMF